MNQNDSEHQHESDYFEHAGLQCKILRMDQGHWCGYVKRPESVEPVRWTSDYDSKHDEILGSEVAVHGGITYGPDEGGWVGFDDGHLHKVAENYGTTNDREAVELETKQLAEQIAELPEDDD